jgi:hypothetical protein
MAVAPAEGSRCSGRSIGGFNRSEILRAASASPGRMLQERDARRAEGETCAVAPLGRSHTRGREVHRRTGSLRLYYLLPRERDGVAFARANAHPGGARYACPSARCALVEPKGSHHGFSRHRYIVPDFSGLFGGRGMDSHSLGRMLTPAGRAMRVQARDARLSNRRVLTMTSLSANRVPAFSGRW